MPTYRDMWPRYAEWWDKSGITQSRASEVKATAKRLFASKTRYQAVEAKTGVPWWMIAVIHEREASQSWSASLAQGDPWNRRSTHVPRGRGPFHSWEEAAIDALHYDGVDRVKDWRLEKALYYLEEFNGWGYHARGLPSPYLWGATNIQRRGKYTSDGHWSSTAWDQQLGCAALLHELMELDPTIKPERET